MKRRNMKKSLKKLKTLNIDFDESAMFHELDAEGDDAGDDDEEEVEEQQTCEWEVQQVLEHNSAITAIVEATLQVMRTPLPRCHVSFAFLMSNWVHNSA